MGQSHSGPASGQGVFLVGPTRGGVSWGTQHPRLPSLTPFQEPVQGGRKGNGLLDLEREFKDLLTCPLQHFGPQVFVSLVVSLEGDCEVQPLQMAGACES